MMFSYDVYLVLYKVYDYDMFKYISKLHIFLSYTPVTPVTQQQSYNIILIFGR